MILTTTDVPDSSNITTQLIIIVILIFVNAFFAASELAILSANSTKLKILAEKNGKKAKLVLKLQEDETKLLSTIQVGITLAGFFSSATAAVSLSEGMANSLNKINFPFAEQVALIIVTLILSYFTLVLGELLPKRLALRNPEKIAMFVARPISIIKKIFRPIVFILSGSCTLIAKLLRIDKNSDEAVTEEEILALVEEATDDGVILKSEESIIKNAISFGDLSAKDVMKPRIDVFMIDINDSLTEIKKRIKQEKYTRIPVYDTDVDNIIGIINIKDIFFNLKSSYTVDDLKNIMRKPLFVVESISASALFNKLKQEHKHAAIVIDEVGSVSGYVTMEDLIEEITGDILDEHDDDEKDFVKIDDNTFILSGTLPIQDVNKLLDIDLKKDIDYSSLGGYIQNCLQRIPSINDVYYLEKEKIGFKILEMSNNRILKVEIKLDYSI